MMTVMGATILVLIFGGLQGLFFFGIIFMIAYCMENNGGGQGNTNVFSYSALSTGSGSAPRERGRANIKGVKDLPKSPAKC